MLEESPALEVKCSRRDEHYWIITFAIVSAKEKKRWDGGGGGQAGMNTLSGGKWLSKVGSSGEVV